VEYAGDLTVALGIALLSWALWITVFSSKPPPAACPVRHRQGLVWNKTAGFEVIRGQYLMPLHHLRCGALKFFFPLQLVARLFMIAEHDAPAEQLLATAEHATAARATS
jgi:hypothetical protein